MSTMTTDRIEKQIQLRAPRSRVWRALTDAKEFGEWFGVTMAGPFKPGARVTGQITFKGYEDMTFAITIERMEPERLFSYRWHPGDTRGVDVSSEPMTLVEFNLEEIPEGTLLRVTESGFDRIPLARRASAFGSNEQGWAGQMKSIARYLGEPV